MESASQTPPTRPPPEGPLWFEPIFARIPRALTQVSLEKGDGPFYFAGDHVSHINAWQEGAALSALRAVQMIGARVQAAA